MTFDWQLTLALSYLGFGQNMRLVCKKWNPDSLPASFVSDTRPKVISLYSPACLIFGFWHAYTGLAVLSRSVVFDSLHPHGLQPTRLLCPWDSPGKNTGVGCHALLQGIFLTQGSNPGLPDCRQILYYLSHQGSPYWALTDTKCTFSISYEVNIIDTITAACCFSLNAGGLSTAICVCIHFILSMAK